MKREIRFTTGCHPYQGGEVAGFDPEVAEQLVARGVAVYLHSMVGAAPVNKMMVAAPASDKTPQTIVSERHAAAETTTTPTFSTKRR